MKNLIVLLFATILFFGIAGCPKDESATGFVETRIVNNPATRPDSGSVPIDNSTPLPGTSPDEGTPSPVPEPATIFLLGSGLVGIAAIGRKRFKK